MVKTPLELINSLGIKDKAFRFSSGSVEYQSSHFTVQAYSNPSGYENQKVDDLIAKAVLANNHKDAVAAWKEVQAAYAGDYPYLYLVNIQHCYFVSDRLDISPDTQIPHPHGHGIPIICNMKDWEVREER